MSNDNTLPEELQKQIKCEAKVYAEYNAWFGGMDEITRSDLKDWDMSAYIAGATEYAHWKEKYEEAKELLAVFIKRHEAGLLPDRFIYNDIKHFLDGGK